MESGFTNNDSSRTSEKKEDKSSLNEDANYAGKITQTIGRGEDARNSFVYLTLKWAFIVGISITGLIVINNWFFEKNLKVPDIMGDISSTWEIVIPVITLALGYAFGKSKD